MFGFGPSENDIQAKMRQIEQTRQAGGMMSPHDMDGAGQEALKRLLHGQQPQAQPQQPAPQAPQGIGNDIPASTANGLKPQGPDPRVTPQQGGIWADAEAAQRNRALAGVPTVK